jgi:tight adherence protein C
VVTLLPILAFAFGTLMVASVAYLLLGKGTVTIDQRLREVTGAPEPAPEFQEHAEQVAKFLKRVGERAPQSASELGKIRQRLVQAGYRRGDALAIFLGIRVAFAALLFALVGTPIIMRPNFFMAMVAAAAGYMLPGFGLARLAARRQHRIRMSLADALDLMVVSVEAGLGLDQALARVAQELTFAYPDLSSELRLVNLELLAGTARQDALRNLSERTGVDDLRSLAAMLIQTDKFGTSVAQSLRVFSETLRTKRRQRAEEAAAKTGVKMVFPLVLCIFPAIWIVTIGPAAIKFVRVLGPMGSGGQ